MDWEHTTDLARNHLRRNAWIVDARGTMMRILCIGIRLSSLEKH